MFKKGSFLRELPIIVVSALIISIVIKTFFLHFFFIPSGSMENTLQVGDRIAVNKFGALFSEIKRGEVVVFSDPDKWLGEAPISESSSISNKLKSGLITVGVLPDPAKQYLIKRVIGVGGDNVTCCDSSGKVQVNGVSITEPYIYPGDKPSEITEAARKLASARKPKRRQTFVPVEDGRTMPLSYRPKNRSSSRFISPTSLAAFLSRFSLN